MSIRFDEKGKFFTDVVSKESVPVIIQTLTHRVRGMLHVRPQERLTDEINQNEQFFAITEATILNDSGEVLYACDFFAINRDHIVWILPENQMKPAERGGEA
jgi:hypothetical protein